MKYIKNKINKYLVFTLLLVSVFSTQALNLNNHINAKDNDKLTQKGVLQPVVPTQQAETYIAGRRVQYDQWVLQCMNGSVTGNEKCNLIHQINNKNNQQIIKIEALKTVDSDTIIFHLPLGSYLPFGAKLIVGESEYSMPITTCLVSGCQAKIKPHWNLIQQLKRKDKAVVQLLHINQKQKLNIKFSLMGYSTGFKEIK
jgi:invasion protein IalB